MTDFRTLCAELVELDQAEPGDYADWRQSWNAAIARARAALAQPEAIEPTEEELLRTFGTARNEHCYDGPIDDWPRKAERAATIHALRVVLARWGQPAAAPVPVSDRPWQRDGWCDPAGRCWFHSEGREFGDWYLLPVASITSVETHCLPWWAIPLPQSTTSTP